MSDKKNMACDVAFPQNISCDFNDPNTIKTIEMRKSVEGTYQVRVKGDDFWYDAEFDPVSKTFSFGIKKV